uniref:Uncharacterized protein n=1 Tax=Tanacetum cinerariifolium TaxID=118510 RepID=A0A6L2P2I3_TANCI|nr:hypothetical protein [Tanacetum cinerariifolium]
MNVYGIRIQEPQWYLLEAVEKRFGGNDATKKTQKNLLKQQFENFSAPSLEMLDQTFDRLQKLSDQAEEGPNYALMAYTSSSSDLKVSNDFTCSKTCLETVKLLKSQNEQLLKDLKKSELMVLGYKKGLKSEEERLEFFKKYKFIYLEDIKVLKVEIQMKEIAIKEITRKLKVAQKEKDGIQLKVDKFENASKSLNKLIDCQIVNNCKKGLDKFANKPVAENTKSSEEEIKVVRKNNDALVIKEWVSDDEEDNVSQPKIMKKNS